MKRHLLLLASLWLVPWSSNPALHAAGPQFWRIEGPGAFLEGELRGLSLDAEGRLRLGAAPRQLFDPVAPNAWAVTVAGDTVYVGTGNDGRLLRFRGEQGSLVFDSDELEIHAVAVSPDGTVYAATSPDGAVYAVDAGGRVSRFFDPSEKYIWALACDSEGTLYVATGAEARVYRVRPDGQASVVLSAAETHLLSLALDGRGHVYAGSAPEGIVYRVAGDGRVSVLVDSPFQEIRALAASTGGVFAAAVDATALGTAAAPAPPETATPVPQVTVTESITVVGASGAPLSTTDAGAPQAAPKGAVLFVADDGEVERLWTSAEDVPYGLLADEGGVLVGTGHKGKLYRVTRDRRWSLAATVAAEQVTALAATAGRGAILVTSNPARLFALDGTLAGEGTFVSKVKDAATSARWGRVTWEGRADPGTTVRLETRSGNTSHPDATWTDWAEPKPAPGAPAPLARFLQVRLTLAGKGGASPSVEAVAASYLQRNSPPEVAAITVHPPGEVFQKPISGEPEILGLDPDPFADRQETGRAAAATPPAVTFSRKMFQRGMRTVSWQAEDPNGDPLLFDVQYRAIGDERWRFLRRSLTEPVLAWDTSTVPNGRYLVRVVATDARGNPPGLALTGSRDSASFEVDNTPPAISATLDGRRIRVAVRDDSPVSLFEVSVDAGRWETAHPVDGIADSPDERYEVVPRGMEAPGPHVVVLRASDVLGNTSTVRVDVP